VNAARRTSGKGSSSWLTISTEDACRVGSAEGWKEYEDKHKTTQARLRNQIHNWPTVCASEVRQGFQDRSRGMKGSQESLTTAVVKDAANWPTPIQGDSHLASTPEAAQRRIAEGKVTLSRLMESGQVAPASSSSLGSRQGLWPTPDTQTGPHGARGVSSNPNHQSAKSLEATARQWATPQAHDAQGPKTPEQIAAMRAKGHGVKNLNEQACWGTPTARDHKSGRGNEDRQYKELTPMVERTQAGKLNQNWVCCLMGVPMGWVDPMCPVSVIKNWPRFVSGWLRAQTAQIPSGFSAMELCLPPQSELSEFSLAS
jgi:hypothetical protein